MLQNFPFYVLRHMYKYTQNPIQFISFLIHISINFSDF